MSCGDAGADRPLLGRGKDRVYGGSKGDIVTPGAERVRQGLRRYRPRPHPCERRLRRDPRRADADLLIAGSGEDRFYGWAGDLLKAASDDGPEDYSKVALATTPVMSEPRTPLFGADVIVHTS